MAQFHGHRLLSDDDEPTAKEMQILIDTLQSSFVCAYFHRETREFFERLFRLWFTHYPESDETRLLAKQKVRVSFRM